MHRKKILLAVLLACWPAAAADFSGKSAIDFTRQAVEFGPRPPGSDSLARLRDFITKQLSQWNCQIEEDRFSADTPQGEVEMTNVIARFLGRSEQILVVSGHYDTKRLPGVRFVGANDAGSSTGFLLELARVLSETQHELTVYLVWFDGEEAFDRWSDTDGVYGSRHLAEKWRRDGTLDDIAALINVDMIGDADLGILREHYSTRSLQNLIWGVARSLGHERHFLDRVGAVEDDHVPFLRLGVSAVDLIDFDYGQWNRYWHTSEDTMDKLSADSFQVVGDVVLETLDRLAARQ